MNLVKCQKPVYSYNVNNLLNEMLNEYSKPLNYGSRNATPAVNIQESEKAFNLQFFTPGFSKEDFVIKKKDDVLTVSVELKEEKKKYKFQEFQIEGFERKFKLPKTVESEQINAKYLNGILSVELLKKEVVENPAVNIDVA